MNASPETKRPPGGVGAAHWAGGLRCYGNHNLKRLPCKYLPHHLKPNARLRRWRRRLSCVRRAFWRSVRWEATP